MEDDTASDTPIFASERRVQSVLVIDDNEITLSFIVGALQRERYTVYKATPTEDGQLRIMKYSISDITSGLGLEQGLGPEQGLERGHLQEEYVMTAPPERISFIRDLDAIISDDRLGAGMPRGSEILLGLRERKEMEETYCILMSGTYADEADGKERVELAVHKIDYLPKVSKTLIQDLKKRLTDDAPKYFARRVEELDAERSAARMQPSGESGSNSSYRFVPPGPITLDE